MSNVFRSLWFFASAVFFLLSIRTNEAMNKLMSICLCRCVRECVRLCVRVWAILKWEREKHRHFWDTSISSSVFYLMACCARYMFGQCFCSFHSFVVIANRCVLSPSISTWIRSLAMFFFKIIPFFSCLFSLISYGLEWRTYVTSIIPFLFCSWNFVQYSKSKNSTFTFLSLRLNFAFFCSATHLPSLLFGHTHFEFTALFIHRFVYTSFRFSV